MGFGHSIKLESKKIPRAQNIRYGRLFSYERQHSQFSVILSLRETNLQ